MDQHAGQSEAAGPEGFRPLIESKVEQLRGRLLSLSLQNGLLQTRLSDRSRSALRVVDEVPNVLYAKLAGNGGLVFRALPPLDDEPADERTAGFRTRLEEARVADADYLAAMATLEASGGDESGAAAEKIERTLKDRLRAELGLPPRRDPASIAPAEHARAHGIDPSYDLPSAREGRDAPRGRLQLLLLPDTAERKLSGVYDLARGHLQETGINTLFGAFGFLQWYESPDSDRALYAPLLLMPLQMRRELRENTYAYSVTGTGEDAEINLTLSEKLRKDFLLALPDFGEDDTPESYWVKVEAAVATQPRWRVRRWVVVGIFPFARMAMYHDLDAKRWPEPEALLSHPVLEEVLLGREEVGGEADIHDVDDPVVEGEAPLLITDADSSQHSAVIDAMRGQNLVIKGPPGTGKSQTITNIIAAALARGERVLFVAEKMAALEVVENRLEQAGLGAFCLELHSEKARRADVAQALKARLEYRAPEDPDELDRKLTELRTARETLNRYARLMNSPLGGTGFTIHEIFWAAQRAEAQRPDLPAAIDRVRAPAVETISRETMERVRARLDMIAGAYARAATGGRLGANPWRGIGKDALTPFDISEIINAALRVRDEAAAAAQASTAFEAEFGWTPGATAAEIDASARAVADIERDISRTRTELLAPLLDPAARSAGRKLLERKAAFTEIDTWLAAQECPAACDEAAVVALADEADEAGVERLCPADLADAVAAMQRELDELDHCGRLVEALGRAFGRETSMPLQELSLLVCAVEHIARTSRKGLAARLPAMLEPGAHDALTRAHFEARRLKKERAELDRVLQMERELDPDALETHAAALRRAGFFGWLRSSVRAARRAVDACSRAERISDSEAVVALERAAAHVRAWRRFERDPALSRLCGAFFRGMDTEFDRLEEAARFIDAARGAFAETTPLAREVLRVLLERDAPALEALRGFAAEPAFTKLKAILEQSGGRGNDSLETVVSALRARRDKTIALDERCAKAELSGVRIRFGDFGRLIKALELRHSLHRALANAEIGPVLFGTAYRGAETDTSGLAESLALAETAGASAAPPGMAAALFRDGSGGAVAEASTGLRALAERRRAVTEALARFIEAGALDVAAFFDGVEPDRIAFAALASRLEAASANRDALAAWAAFAASRASAAELGLEALVNTYLAEGRGLDGVFQGYEYVAFRALARAAYGLEGGLLARHDGPMHEALQTRFRELDQEILVLNRLRLAARLARRPVPPGVAKGRKSELTERALIEHESAKSRAHIPIRELLRRAGAAVQALKPCFMMSPLSVAQYLAPGALAFDLLIIDEASQMRPEEAIGALVRARRAVIVGDPQQLPPTSFFHKNLDDPSGDEPEEEKITNESILDLARAVFRPEHNLLWHYRSRHESLIAFSNHEFYEGRLLVYPSPVGKHPEFGVHYRKVEGVYQAGANPAEARAIVEAALAHMHRHPERSLGLVALNQTQRDLIREEMERAILSDDHAGAYVARWEGTLEPFFVKNLENVQGDERDVIMISTVYGPDRSGQVMQRFGPITHATGHRRLNVLFTRAKLQTIVFSSMRSDDIRVEASSSRGVHVLKRYLEYAATGRLDTGVVTGRAPDSDFERAVAEQLEAMGCETVPQVGVAGYFIDIGVRHPAWPHGFLLGIECDGAAYHSARSARDRDRLRQRVLEGLGWTIHRVWSTDWFRNPGGEGEKLRRRIGELLEARRAAAGPPARPQLSVVPRR